MVECFTGSAIASTALLEKKKSVPWQFFLSGRGTPHFCPAVSINRRFLLASQSCLRAFQGKSKVELTDLSLYPAFPSDQVRARYQSPAPPAMPRVLRVRHHPDFKVLDDGGFVGDLSLVEIDTGHDLADKRVNLAPVCLPPVAVSHIFVQIVQCYICFTLNATRILESQEANEGRPLCALLLACQCVLPSRETVHRGGHSALQEEPRVQTADQGFRNQ